MSPTKNVVILGAGFAGLNAAKKLGNVGGIAVTVIDQRNHHLFQPLLYQVATAGLNPSDIAIPIRSILSAYKNIGVHMGKIVKIDAKGKTLHSERGTEIPFDYLLLACGAQHSYFGHNEWEEFAPGLKTVEQATEIRRRILVAFESAENEKDVAKQSDFMTFVVVGGGPTGVELAGAIADISRGVLAKDFRRIDPRKARVILVEAGPRLLGMFAEDLASHAMRDLQQMGVEVMTNARVANIDADGVAIAGKESIRSKTVIWAAGVQAAPIGASLEVTLDKAGRVQVQNDLSVPGYPDIFVAGDQAHLELSAGKLMPGLAPAAIQSGEHVAKNILASIRGEPRRPFKYFDKGQMATIGKRRAIAETGKLHLTGFIAWMAWMFIHILYLVGFKNRISVLAEWAWSYTFSKRGARLITSKEWKLFRSGGESNFSNAAPILSTTSPAGEKQANG